MASAKEQMFDKFQPWVLSTYGDSAKTKTITLKKAYRIQALLKCGEKEAGSEPAGSEAAKFRLWVKSKGLQLAQPSKELGDKKDLIKEDIEEPVLYLPTGTDKNVDGKVHFVYKKVAVVEKFFDIIYSVHVESSSDTQLRGRAGKHCGQKRTYRAVADQYAFIPREAISRFLLYCTECQRKQPVSNASCVKPPTIESSESRQSFDSASRPLSEDQGSIFNPKKPGTPVPLINPPATPPATPPNDLHTVPKSPVESLHPVISGEGGERRVGLPTTYLSPGNPNDLTTSRELPVPSRLPLTPVLQHDHYSHQAAAAHAMAYAQAINAMQSFASRSFYNPNGYQAPPQILPVTAENLQKLENSSDIDLSLPITSTYLRRMRGLGGLGSNIEDSMMHLQSPVMSLVDSNCIKKEEEMEECHEQSTRTSPWSPYSQSNGQQPVQKAQGLQVSQLSHLLQNGANTMSPGRSEHSREDSIITDDTSSNGNKDEDDDDDEDDGNEDALDGFCRDPERLKAFNMFVRLFVDENLDRHVPISKQPKEKIQAIIDSCTRQFPEFSERARKRIRTYLKSCRRTKRSREQAGLDTNNRPTPPHLTSVLAEQLLARACENEAENAKRMRMGIEPISQSMPTSLITSSTVDTLSGPAQPGFAASFDKSKMDYKSEQLVNLLAATQQQQPVQQAPPTPGSLASSPVTVTSSMHRQTFQPNAQVFGSTPVGLLPGVETGAATNGQSQVDGLKKPPLLNHKLNGTEMTAVRQLITGYRESAAFLLRSADELEHLIQIQPKL